MRWMHAGAAGAGLLWLGTGGAVALVACASTRRPRAAGAARRLTAASLVGATALLATALVRLDFALVVVADSTTAATPWAYRLAGLWSGMAGSLLLRATVLAASAAALGHRRLDAA